MKVARLEEWQPNVSTIVIPPPPSALVAKNQNLKKKESWERWKAKRNELD